MINKSKIELIHGDCLDKLKDIHRDFVIVTDPPFNIGYHYNNYSDDIDDDDYYTMLSVVFGYAPFVVIHYPENIYKISWRVEEIPQRVISWVYNSNTAKQHRDIAFFGINPDFSKLSQPYKNPNDRRIMKRIENGKMARGYDWWNINQVKNVSSDKSDHPCQMPLEVMENIVKLLPEDKTICDPFMGSGTTGVACKKLGRDFIGIELDAEYMKIAEARINSGQELLV